MHAAVRNRPTVAAKRLASDSQIEMSEIVSSGVRQQSVAERHTATNRPQHRAGAMVAIVTVAMTLFARCDVCTCATASSSFQAGAWTRGLFLMKSER